MAVKFVRRKAGVTIPPPVQRSSKLEKALAKAQPTERRFKRIYDLPSEMKDLLHGMFQDGKPVKEIATTMQEMGCLRDVLPNTLTQYLYRYKWEILDKQALIRTETMRESTKAKLLSEIKQSYDVVEELELLIEAQKIRVAKLLGREQTMPMLFKTLGGEMKLLSGFLQQYADLKFNLGLMTKKNLMKITSPSGETTVVESEGQAHVMVSMEQREKVEKAAQAFFESLTKSVGEQDEPIREFVGIGEAVGGDDDPVQSL